jgi:hypothetical protein
MIQYIPSNLDVERLLIDHPPKEKLDRDALIHIIHLLTEIPANTKHRIDLNGFVPLNAAILQSRIHNYNVYLAYLIQNNIIETDNQYIPEEKSRGYRFTEKYRTFNKQEEITNYTLVKNIERHQATKIAPKKVYPVLRNYFNENLTLAYDSAKAFLDADLSASLLSGDPGAYPKYNSAIMSIDRLKDHNYFFWVDDTCNRLHTNLTNIKSELRNFITYEGQTLVSVDLKNSQPYLSTILLTPEFYKQSSTTKSKFNYYQFENTLPIPIFNKQHPIEHPIMLVKNEDSLDNKGISDIQCFKEKVTEGMLYEYIAEELTNQGLEGFKDRKAVKEMMFSVLFSDNRFIGAPDAEPKRIFRDLYPAVYKVFSYLKSRNHKNLPILLQNIESSLILGSVAKRITFEEPYMPIFTIHDSIVCPVGKEEYVKEVIIEEAISKIGLPPKVKYEYWIPTGS